MQTPDKLNGPGTHLEMEAKRYSADFLSGLPKPLWVRTPTPAKYGSFIVVWEWPTGEVTLSRDGGKRWEGHG
jgi:hypothetical protein